MKIELISPAQGSYKKSKLRRTHNIALGILSALTPSHYKINITEEQLGEEISYNDADLVGISMMSNQAHRGYEVAAEFRKRGAKVVLGGIHPSVLPDEAIKHADAVVIGEAEYVWKDVLADAKKGALKKIYKADRLVDMKDIPHIRQDLYKSKTSFSFYQVQATRGCPFKCEFCSCTIFFGNYYRTRPIENVISEIKKVKEKKLFFADDNIMGNPSYARKLFKALIPLKKRWIGQSSLNLSSDPSLIKLAYESGCRGLYIGIETLDNNNLKETESYTKNKAASEKELLDKIKIIQDTGIMIMSAMIFGFDNDDISVFRKTIKLLRKGGVSNSTFTILTPYPGTKTYERLKKEGRLLTEDWSKYNNAHVVFKPKLMNERELELGVNWSHRNFYSIPYIASRFFTNYHNPFLYLATNIGYHFRNRKSWKEKMMKYNIIGDMSF